MKVRFQWAQRNPSGWREVEASAWASLPTRGVPTALGGQNNVEGWICNVNVQGITVEGRDHVAIEPVTIGLDEGVRLTAWNDDPEDYPAGERCAYVYTILPLAPDPELGFAINTRQSLTAYLEGPRYDRWITHTPKNTTVRPWAEFVAPPDAVTRHGVWLSDVKYAEHVAAAPQGEWGWMHWCEHLPLSETEIETQMVLNRSVRALATPRRKLKEQRAQGRYRQAERTITYYQRDTDRAAGAYVFTHEDALETTTAGAVSESVTTDANAVQCWFFSTPANEPNSSDWPSGVYHAQFNCTAASTGLTYGVDTLTIVGNWHRMSSDLASNLGAIASTNGFGPFSGTGLKLDTSQTNDQAAGAAADRFSVACGATGDSHADAITLQFNTTDSYADGPWTGGGAAAVLQPFGLLSLGVN